MEIMICGISYKVEEKEDAFDADTHFGQIDYVKGIITINKNLSPAIKKETLCHEIIHGIFQHLGKEQLRDDEELVQALGNSISQTFDIRTVNRNG